MLALAYTGSQWCPVSPKTCEAKRSHHHNTWKATGARIKAKGGIQLRDISALLNQCPHPEAYRFCAEAYRAYIQTSLGANPDIRLVARMPLFTLLNAPRLASEDIPWLADKQINQAYATADWFNCEIRERRLLVCTTSRTHTLSMPLQVFHAYALQRFNAVAYLFDIDRSHYRDCLGSTVDCVRSLKEKLLPGAIGFVGTSAGGCIAIHLCNQHVNGKALAGSPVMSKFPELECHLRASSISDLHAYLRITYGENPIDNQHKDFFAILNRKKTKAVAYNMSYISPTHASLGVGTLDGTLNELLHWLSIPRDTGTRL